MRREYLGLLLTQWVSTDASVRVLALVVLRRLAIESPYPFLPMCLKVLWCAVCILCSFRFRACI